MNEQIENLELNEVEREAVVLRDGIERLTREILGEIRFQSGMSAG